MASFLKSMFKRGSKTSAPAAAPVTTKSPAELWLIDGEYYDLTPLMAKGKHPGKLPSTVATWPIAPRSPQYPNVSGGSVRPSGGVC
jgi:hypothetical protein